MSRYNLSEQELSDLDTIILKEIDIENFVFNCNEKTFEQNKDLIINLDPPINKYWLQKLITFAGRVKIFNFKLLGDLYQLTGETIIKLPYDSSFCQYLFARGLTNIEDFDSPEFIDPNKLLSIENYENPIEKDTIWYFILIDDIHNFVNSIEVNNLDINNEKTRINGMMFTFVDFAAFCNSINIFKYLFLKQVEIQRKTLSYAIHGGSGEIIDFLQSQGFSFNDVSYLAISSHNDTLIDWLLENFKDYFFYLPYCVESFHTGLFMSLLEVPTNISYINSQIYNYKTALFFAVEHNDIALTKYILYKGGDKNIKDDQGKKAFDYAETPEMINI